MPYPASGVYDISRARDGARLRAGIRPRTRHRRLSGEPAGRSTSRTGAERERGGNRHAQDTGTPARPATSAIGAGRGARSRCGTAGSTALCSGAGPRCGFQNRQRALSVPVGGNAEFNVLVFPLAGDPTCIIQMPTFIAGWRSAQDWVGDVRARKGTWAGFGGRANQGAGGSAAANRHGRPRRAARSGRLVTAQRLRPIAGAVAGGQSRRHRRHAGEVRAIKSAEEIEVLERAASLGDLMMYGLSRCRAPGRRESRSMRRCSTRCSPTEAKNHPVPLGLRPLSPAASFPRADHAPHGTWRRHHLRDAIPSTAATSPTSSEPSAWASRTRSSAKSTRAA